MGWYKVEGNVKYTNSPPVKYQTITNLLEAAWRGEEGDTAFVVQY